MLLGDTQTGCIVSYGPMYVWLISVYALHVDLYSAMCLYPFPDHTVLPGIMQLLVITECSAALG
jgi:hypothetical protein